MSTMRVYDPAFNFLFAFSEYSQLQVNLKYYGKGNLAVAVDEESSAAYFLQKEHYITYEHNDKTYPFIIKRINLNNGIVTVQAVSPHELFERRITIPHVAEYAITGTGTPDKIIKDYIRASTVGNRGLPIRLAPDHEGGSLTDTSRLKNLGEEVSRICETYSIGESWELDPENKCFIFDTYQGVDKTAGNSYDNPPCVFSEKYHNLSDYQYDYNATTIVTTPIVAGTGEGVDREIYVVGDDKEGLERYESLVDARDVERGNESLLAERGNAKIVSATETVSTMENQNGNLVFGVDYDLGDLVSVRFDVPKYQSENDYYDMVKQQIQVNQRVAEVVITIEGGSCDIDIKYGNIVLNKTSVMSRDIEQLKSSY